MLNIDFIVLAKTIKAKNLSLAEIGILDLTSDGEPFNISQIHEVLSEYAYGTLQNHCIRLCDLGYLENRRWGSSKKPALLYRTSKGLELLSELRNAK